MACEFVKDLGLSFPNETSKKKCRYYILFCPYCKKEFKAQARYYNTIGLKSCGKCASGLRDLSVYTRTHGLSTTPIYHVWSAMKARCNNKLNPAFKNYGGRGISVCDEWSNDFKKFYDWAMQNGYKKGLQIDRIDNDGHYTPSNCRYVTPFVNMSNQREMVKTNTSGYKGVSLCNASGKFCSFIKIKGKTKNLGTYSTAIEASGAYEKARTEKYKDII